MTTGRAGNTTVIGETTNGIKGSEVPATGETGAGVGLSNSALVETLLRMKGVVLVDERLNVGNFGRNVRFSFRGTESSFPGAENFAVGETPNGDGESSEAAVLLSIRPISSQRRTQVRRARSVEGLAESGRSEGGGYDGFFPPP